MTLTQLSYIIAVDTFRSFAAAANHCCVTQPTLSMQIRKLEEELGVQLFDRSKKPVIPTAIGQGIVLQARTILKEADRIPELIQAQLGEIQGELRIGIIPTLSPYLLPRFITQFIQQYPKVSLVVEELLSEQIIYKLNHDLLDLGIMVAPEKQQGLRVQALFYEAFVVYASTSHPLIQKNTIAFSDLNLDEMWLLKEGHCFRSQSLKICGEEQAENSSLPLRFEMGSLETLKKIIERQYGYTLLPELAVLDLNDGQQQYIRYFQSPPPVREISLVVHRSFLKEQLIHAFREVLLDHIPQALLQKERGDRIPWD
ncbi:MAG: LysR substrate-binding domain-containing protein [Bacteroidota bacterium]